MELIHKTIIERGKVFQAVRARFFQALEEKDLSAGIELFKQLAQLSHGVAAGRYTQNVMNESLDELLAHILTRYISFGELSGREELVERYRLCGKWD